MLNAEIKHVDRFIFYTNDELIIYRQDRKLTVSNCDGLILDFIPCPISYKIYQIFDDLFTINLVFSGNIIISINKESGKMLSNKLDPVKIGKCITKLFNYNGIIFGTKLRDGIQIINYNIEKALRTYQSSSWKFDNFNDLILTENSIFALMNKTFLIELSKTTGELLWHRFETGSIGNKILFQNKLYYSCNGYLKIFSKELETKKIPLFQINTLLLIHDYSLFFIANNKNICKYNLKLDKVEWDIDVGQDILIHQVFEYKQNNIVYNIMCAKIGTKFILMNLDSGKIIHVATIEDMKSLVVNGQKVLIHFDSNITKIVELI